jgi:hypothetical protein
MLAIAALSSQAGCVTGRRTFELPIAAHEVPAANKGRVYIGAVTDDRQFENRPSEPSTPSIDGDVTKLSAAQKDQMIGRQRNGFGKAMGDIALAQGAPHAGHNSASTNNERGAAISECLVRRGRCCAADLASGG